MGLKGQGRAPAETPSMLLTQERGPRTGTVPLDKKHSVSEPGPAGEGDAYPDFSPLLLSRYLPSGAQSSQKLKIS